MATVTIGTLAKKLSDKKFPLDLSAIKCIIIDEADTFFGDKENLSKM